MDQMVVIFALIPASVLLALSFFVLAVVGKAEKPGMRSFGLVVATLLWLSVLLVVSAGIKGHCPMMGKMYGKPMPGMMQEKRGWKKPPMPEQPPMPGEPMPKR